MNRATNSKAAAVVTSLLLLTACSSSDSTDPNTENKALTKTYAFYQTAPNGILYHVDPDSPSTPGNTKISGTSTDFSGSNIGENVFNGSLDSSVGSVTDFHIKYHLFTDTTSSSIYKIQSVTSAGAAVAAQVSSESNFIKASYCGNSYQAYNDLANPENSVFAYKYDTTTGGLNDCSAKEWRYITMDMDSSTAPKLVGGNPILALMSSTGAISGFVVKSGNTINKTAADFSGPTEITKQSGASFTDIANIKKRGEDGDYFLLSFEHSTGPVFILRRYNQTGLSTSSALHTSSVAFSRFKEDGKNVYFIDNADNTLRRISIADTTETTSTAIATFSGAFSNSLYLTDSHIVFVDNNDGTLYSVSRSATDTSTKTALKDSSNVNINAITSIAAVGGNYVYYYDQATKTAGVTVVGGATGVAEYKGTYTPTAGGAAVDGGAEWTGTDLTTSITAGSVGLITKHVFLTQAIGDNMSGQVTFQHSVWDAATNTQAAVLGETTELSAVMFKTPSLGNNQIGTIGDGTTPTGDDVYFTNKTSGSLTKVADTPLNTFVIF
ncbi:MAG: hypothetical protein OEZ47_08750 [Gammaproteobacteria bacterium]|nr:hypothetical protein [Gammaproteobacteria bacterium]